MDNSTAGSRTYDPSNDSIRACLAALVLSRREIASLMSPRDYLSAVEAGFRAYANGDAEVPLPTHLKVSSGGFHAIWQHALASNVGSSIQLGAA